MRFNRNLYSCCATDVLNSKVIIIIQTPSSPYNDIDDTPDLTIRVIYYSV